MGLSTLSKEIKLITLLYVYICPCCSRCNKILITTQSGYCGTPSRLLLGIRSLIIVTDYSHLIHQLPHAKTAGFRSGNRERCLEGTRVDLLREIKQWAAEESGHPVFWLCGIAGIGKTTVAQSFAECIYEDGRLGASFFCSRDIPERSNINLIFPSLAFHLAYQFPPPSSNP
jgi:hypothetical protein